MWFPTHISDLDKFRHEVLEAGAELESDHPGFNDAEYRERRARIVANAFNYEWGQPLPDVEYSEAETATWAQCYNNLAQLYPTHACKEYLRALQLLQENIGYGPEKIPQIREISAFLQRTTGFTLRPVAGLLSSRDFLSGLAFRVFHSTQYIRHHSKPLYTPEPDVVHELLGHVPLFCDPDFAAFSQQIGLASLGASDEDVKKLATCYWFTIEFGLTKDNGKPKAYGAGLLSSFGELKYCLGGDEEKPKLAALEPEVTGTTDYPITTYQPTYFVSESFADATRKMIAFGASLDRPFAGLRYNAPTSSVEVLDSHDKQRRAIAEARDALAAVLETM